MHKRIEDYRRYKSLICLNKKWENHEKINLCIMCYNKDQIRQIARYLIDFFFELIIGSIEADNNNMKNKWAAIIDELVTIRWCQ